MCSANTCRKQGQSQDALFVYMYHVFVLPFGKSCDFPLYNGFPSRREPATFNNKGTGIGHDGLDIHHC